MSFSITYKCNVFYRSDKQKIHCHQCCCCPVDIFSALAATQHLGGVLLLRCTKTNKNQHFSVATQQNSQDLLRRCTVCCRLSQYFAATQHWGGVLLLRCTKTNKTNIPPSRRNKTHHICCVAALTTGSTAQNSICEPSGRARRCCFEELGVRIRQLRCRCTR